MKWCGSITSKLLANAPKALSIPAKLMPFALEQQIFERLLNPLFKEQIEDGELDFLSQKRLRIEVTDLQKCWDFTFENERLVLCVAGRGGQGDSHFDLCFSGPMNSFILLASQKADADTLFFNRKLTICGDTELGLEVKSLIDRLDLTHLPKPFAFGLNQYSELLQHQST